MYVFLLFLVLSSFRDGQLSILPRSGRCPKQPDACWAKMMPFELITGPVSPIKALRVAAMLQVTRISVLCELCGSPFLLVICAWIVVHCRVFLSFLRHSFVVNVTQMLSSFLPIIQCIWLSCLSCLSPKEFPAFNSQHKHLSCHKPKTFILRNLTVAE